MYYTKTQLRTVFKLNSKAIEAIGEPDQKKPNPYNEESPICLYDEFRIANFIDENNGVFSSAKPRKKSNVTDAQKQELIDWANTVEVSIQPVTKNHIAEAELKYNWGRIDGHMAIERFLIIRLRDFTGYHREIEHCQFLNAYPNHDKSMARKIIRQRLYKILAEELDINIPEGFDALYEGHLKYMNYVTTKVARQWCRGEISLTIEKYSEDIN